MIVRSYHNPVSKELYKLFVCEGFEPLSVGYHLLLPFFVLFAMYSSASAIWSKDKHMPTRQKQTAAKPIINIAIILFPLQISTLALLNNQESASTMYCQLETGR